MAATRAAATGAPEGRSRIPLSVRKWQRKVEERERKRENGQKLLWLRSILYIYIGGINVAAAFVIVNEK